MPAMLSQVWRPLRSVFHPNFYRLHLLYFILTILTSSCIFYGSNMFGDHVKFTDALFLCTSAMCNVGLNTVNLGVLNGFQQSVLFVLMLMGDLSLVSISVVVVRRYWFSKRIREFVQHSKTGKRIADDVENERQSTDGRGKVDRRPAGQGEDTSLMTAPSQEHDRQDSSSKSTLSRQQRTHFEDLRTSRPSSSHPRPENHDYLSFEPTLDHKVSKILRRLHTANLTKGRIRNLTQEQERELGGVEYRAL